MTPMSNEAPELRPKMKNEPPYPTNRHHDDGAEGRSTISNIRKGELFRDIAVALKQAGHELCVLHGYEEYPEHISSDIDTVSGDASQIPHILAKYGVATTVQVLQHETTAFGYILCRSREGEPVFITLDAYTDYRSDGRVFFRSEELLEASKPFKFFNVLSPELEFTYYLVKKVLKSSLSEAHARRLGRLYAENPAGCEQQLVRFFPPEEAEFIAEAARSENWEPLLRSRLRSLRRAMLGKVRREHPLQVLRYWVEDLQRRVKRILHPTGLMIAFLGADGSGKSTVVNRVEYELAPAFRKVRRYHLRPHLVLSRTVLGPVTDPHAKLPRGMVASLAKLGLWSVNYTVGYLGTIFPQLVSSTLVLFDRYYHDLLVDTSRYRYGGPLWLARLVGWSVPRPHLVILLDAPPEVLQARKREVSLEETTRQREEYLKLVSGLSNGHVVDASSSLDEVVAGVERIILNYMAERTARKLGLEKGK